MTNPHQDPQPDPEDKGVFEWVHIGLFRIDRAYQRDEVNPRRTQRMASRFSWVRFGSISANKRADGFYYIMDGQQRYLAARTIHIEYLPTMVFSLDGITNEAGAFLGMNTDRFAVRAIEKFKAHVETKNPLHLEITSWLASIGMAVGRANNANTILFVDQLADAWKRDPDSAKRAILLQREIDPDKHQSQELFSGLIWLIRNDVDVETHVPKMKEKGGIAAMKREIVSVAISTGRRGERTNGLGILELINKGLRVKIRVQPKAKP